MKTCTLPGCGKKYAALGMCMAHYQRDLRARRRASPEWGRKYETTCATCDAKFTPKQHNQAFCTKSCSMANAYVAMAPEEEAKLFRRCREAILDGVLRECLDERFGSTVVAAVWKTLSAKERQAGLAARHDYDLSRFISGAAGGSAHTLMGRFHAAIHQH